MKKQKNYKYIIIIVSLLVLSYIVFINTSYYRLKMLYKNPIKIKLVYKNYIYDEYKNYVTISSYNGEEKSVTIPDYINDKPVYAIDDSAFYANDKLEKVKVSKYVIRIGHQSFIGCPNLKEVILQDKVLDIGSWAFKGCPNLEKIYVKKDSKTDKTIKDTYFKKYVVIFTDISGMRV